MEKTEITLGKIVRYFKARATKNKIGGKMFKKNAYLGLFAFLLIGCANFSFIQSDIFSDSRSVTKIYTLPILESINIDAIYLAKEKKKQHIVSKAAEAISLIQREIKNNLEQKGYKINVSNKRFSKLNPQIEQEKVMRDAIALATEYVKVTGPDIDIYTDDKKINLAETFGNTGQDKSLVEKTNNLVFQMSIDADTIMYVYVKTFIAKRFWGLWTTDKSYITFKIDMVNLKKGKVILSFQRTYDRADLLTTKEMLQGLNNILNKIPLRI